MRNWRDDVQPSAATRLLTAVVLLASFFFVFATPVSAQAGDQLCANPTAIPLATSVDGIPEVAVGVTTARGAAAADSPVGTVMSLTESGSRVQVDLPQPLFHTRWTVANIDLVDRLRVDATLEDAAKDVSAAAVTGRLRTREGAQGPGLSMEGEFRLGASRRADILLPGPIDSALFSNGGTTGLDLAIAAGCAAFHAETSSLATPTWDPETERFVARYAVTFANNLPQPSALRAAGLPAEAGSHHIEQLALALDIASPGFGTAEILDLQLPLVFQRLQNPDFDGIGSVDLLTEPSRLVSNVPLTIEVEVAYSPDFEDPIWSEGVDAPAPTLIVSGVASGVPVGANVGLIDGLRSEDEANFVSPAPILRLEHERLETPVVRADGTVLTADRLIVHNDGELGVDEVTVAWDFADLFGPGTELIEHTIVTSGGCADAANGRFDGVTNTNLVVPHSFGIGGRCEVILRATVLPGNIPAPEGTDFQTIVLAEGRSGIRAVTATAAVSERIAQVSELRSNLSEPIVRNRGDGSYEITGDLTIDNEGDQALSNIAARLDITSLDAEGVATPRRVSVDRLHAVGRNCEAAQTPRSTTSTFAAVPSRLELQPGDSCVIDYSLLVRPGSALEGWAIAASVSGSSSRGEDQTVDTTTPGFALPEELALDVTVDTTEPQNLGDGSHVFEVRTEVRNTSDVPLLAVVVEDNVSTQFGARLVGRRTTTDTCSWIDDRRALLPTSGPEGTCLVVSEVTVRPGALLIDWQVGASATATSVSFREVAAGDSSDLFAFVEAPALASTLRIADVERNGDGSFGILLEGTLENVGDIRLARLGTTLNLDAVVGEHPWTLDWTSSQALTISPEYDGRTTTNLLTRVDRLAVEEQRTWLVRITVDAGTESGPFVFEQEVDALSEALASVESTSATSPQPLPLVQLVEDRIEPTNNGDGTWDIRNVVRVRNAGAGSLDDIRVDSDFGAVFWRVLVGDVDVNNQCAETVVGPSGSCEVVTTATIRPWSDLGPYEVSPFIAAFDAAGVSARRLPAAAPVHAPARLLDSLVITERPAIAATVDRSDVTNNGDGTYGLRYRVDSTNEGDVPLYRVDVSNGVAEAFGPTVVSDRLAGDTCAEVSFGNPLAPGATCITEHDVVIRPATELGPWDAGFQVTADTPSGNRIADQAGAEPVAFVETVALDASTSLRVSRNNGDGTYNLLHVVVVENTSDVPLVAIEVTDGPAETFGETLIDRDTLLHSCAWVDASQPLAPGATCEVQSDLRVQPAEALGPWSVPTAVTAASPSGETADNAVETTEITLTEAPNITLETDVRGVENNGDGSFRIVVDLNVANEGDVRVDGFELDLDLADAFQDTTWRIDGLISRDFSVNDEFPQLESTLLLSDPTSLRVSNGGTLTLVLSLTPGTEVGPFTTDLLATGTTPAGFPVESVIEASVDLPAVGIIVVGQATENNRDGSYTVETTYRIANRGTTPLEFVRLTEDVVEIFGGAIVRVADISSNDVNVADLDDRNRGIDLLEWGTGLDVGETADIISTVVVTPGNALGPFNPGARVSALSPTGTPVAEVIVAPEQVEFVEQPALRVEQRLLSRPVWNQSGRFDVSFAIDVINDGDVELRNLQVREDLLNALGWGSSIVVRDVRSELLTPNRDFDGLGVAPADPNIPVDEDAETEPRRDFGDTRLLAGWDTLAAESTATIVLDLTITPETRGIYNTRVLASALSPAGTGLGSDDDEIEASTLTRLTVQGELGVAKRVVDDPRVRADGSVDVTYEILVENAGPFPLSEVEVHDQLSQAFGIGATFVTSRVRAGIDSPCVGLTSSSFDGGTIDPVLVSRVELQPGESCRLQYDVIVTPSKPFPGPFRSSAFAIGSDPFTGTVIDDSTDGTDPDPDNNQEPGDNDLATAVRVELPEPSISVALAASSIEPARTDGWFDVTYAIEVTNDGLIDVRSTRLVADLDDQWPVSFIVRSIESDDLRTNTTFDGDRDIRLLSTQNVLRAGTTATVEVVVSTRRPRNDLLHTVVDFTAVSVVGDAADSRSETSEAEGSPAMLQFPVVRNVTSEAWWDTLTEEEQQMFMLGGGAFAIIFLAMFVSLVRRWNRFTQRRAARREQRAREEDIIDLREPVIDLRDPDVDVREEPQRSRRLRRRRRTDDEHEDRRRRRRRRDTTPSGG